MKFLSKLRCRLCLEGGGVVLSLAVVSKACGPDFPNSYFDQSAEELLAAPEGYFAEEISRLTAGVVPENRAVIGDQRASTLSAERADLERALTERGVEPARASRVASCYEIARAALEAGKADPFHADWRKKEPKLDLLADAPAEFAHYLRGADAWRRDDIRAARVEWQTILDLPVNERRYRSTWAAYMLGRVCLHDAETSASPQSLQAAAHFFQIVRELVRAGLPDPLGLAAASYGWEARAALDAGDYPGAVRLYLAQQATGDRTALESLRRTAARMASLENDQLLALASDEKARRVLTAYFVSRGGPHFASDGDPDTLSSRAQVWAEALEKSGVRALPEADRFAWVTYQAGAFAQARQWLALASEASPEAQWIRAKLALRDGELVRGRQLLAAALASPAVGEAHRAQMAAELGRVCLAVDDFIGALEAWLGGGHWKDAAYAAERVMTLQELRGFVDTRCPVGASVNGATQQDLRSELRNLLARRLARAGQTEAAVNYFPEDQRAGFQAYVAAVKTGFDDGRPATERAAAFWRAAQAVREHGMEWLGTELEPDWAIYGGDFDLTSTSAQRRSVAASQQGPFAATAAEAERLEHQRVPEKRFHYRYRAAELAWWAASLLPNESELTAHILVTAGGWLKARDPKAAEPFYQALVLRCGQTELGREAKKRHWFAPILASGADANL